MDTIQIRKKDGGQVSCVRQFSLVVVYFCVIYFFGICLFFSFFILYSFAFFSDGEPSTQAPSTSQPHLHDPSKTVEHDNDSDDSLGSQVDLSAIAPR